MKGLKQTRIEQLIPDLVMAVEFSVDGWVTLHLTEIVLKYPHLVVVPLRGLPLRTLAVSLLRRAPLRGPSLRETFHGLLCFERFADIERRERNHSEGVHP